MFSISVNCTNAKEAAKILAALGSIDQPVAAKPAKQKLDDADDDETPVATKKRGRPAKVAAPVDEVEETDEEETEEDDEVEEDETEESDDDEVEEDEPTVVTGEDLTKVKKALQAYSKAKGSKDAAVKVLRKFAPSSEKIKVGDLKALLKALKV